MVVSVKSINGRIGLNLEAAEMCSLLNRMSLKTQLYSEDKSRDLLEVSYIILIERQMHALMFD